MGFFSGLLDGFTGKAQQRDIQAANAQATTQLGQGRDAALQQYGTARDMFNPYAEQGARSNALYGDLTGANGVDKYKAGMAGYAGSDPFRDQNADYANNALMRQYSARGQSGGNAGLAVARAQTERGATDFNTYMQRLQGQGQQGLQATGAQSGITTGMGDISNGYGQQMAGNAINYGNAMAGTRNILGNNLMGLAGVGLKAFAPQIGGMFGGGGQQGQTSPGTMANGGWSTSVNKLWM